MTAQIERYRGCLLGMAAGDALGTTVEFCAPGSFKPLTGIVGGGPFNLRPGEWTDDTSMGLCLAASLVETGGFDPRDQMQRYVRWRREGYMSSNGRCFDIGGTTRQALRRFEDTGEPFSGSPDADAAGNGSLMRLAPAAMRFARTPQQAIYYCGESSRTTHAAPTAIDACRFFGGLLVGALAGEPKELLLEAGYAPMAGYWQTHPLHAEVAEVAGGSYKRRRPPEIVGSGYVVRSLEAALWAFQHSSSFTEGCLLAANLGDDADTTAAIYGQIAGAFYGEKGIPPDWLEKLAQREMIAGLAEALYQAAQPA